MAEIGTQNFPRTKRFDMEERKTLVFNAKQRTIGVSQSGIVSHREKHGFRCRGTFHERQAGASVVTPERGSGWRSPGPRGGLSQMMTTCRMPPRRLQGSKSFAAVAAARFAAEGAARFFSAGGGEHWNHFWEQKGETQQTSTFWVEPRNQPLPESPDSPPPLPDLRRRRWTPTRWPARRRRRRRRRSRSSTSTGTCARGAPEAF